jgi:DNA-binding transcriptional LysR family regulator
VAARTVAYAVNWDDLRYFAAALRHGSFIGAARALGCEHTTVSRRLESLERALETKLFLRTPDGLQPTRAALELGPLVEQISSSVQAIERKLAAQDDRVSGTVRLTAPEAFVSLVLSHLLALKARHPELVLEVLADDRALDLLRGEADLALRLAPVTQPDLVVKKLSDVGGAMYAAPSYLARKSAPSPVRELVGHDIVGYDEALAHVPAARWLATHAAGATVVFRGNTLLSVLGAVVAGLGLSVLPCILAEREPGLQRISSEVLCHGTLNLCVHRDLANVARVRAVLAFIGEIVACDRSRWHGA